MPSGNSGHYRRACEFCEGARSTLEKSFQLAGVYRAHPDRGRISSRLFGLIGRSLNCKHRGVPSTALSAEPNIL